jgi:hypothetical protein
VLAAGLGFADRCLALGSFTVDGYHDYARGILPDVQKNIHEAASLQVESFLPILDRWRAEVGVPRWARLYALVSTAWAMRRQNVHQQILTKVMGADAIDERLFLAEGVQGRDALLELLGRILLDRGASALVFDDMHVLDRELMGAATACALARVRT